MGLLHGRDREAEVLAPLVAQSLMESQPWRTAGVQGRESKASSGRRP